MILSFILLLESAFSRSFCFYADDPKDLCPKKSEYISISHFALFTELTFEHETSLQLYISADMNENTKFTFGSMKLNEANIEIIGLQENRVIYLDHSNPINNYKSLSLTRINAYINTNNQVQFNNLSLFMKSKLYTNDQSITVNEFHCDIGSISTIKYIYTSSVYLSFSENDFNDGQIQLFGIDSKVLLNFIKFNSNGEYYLKIIDNQLVIERESKQLKIILDDSSVKISIQNTQNSTIILSSIIERLTTDKYTTIEINSSNNSITRFSECNWPTRNYQIIFNRIGNSIIELENVNLPLKVNSGFGLLNFHLLSKTASISSIQISANTNDQIIIESMTNEVSYFNISKLYMSSNPLTCYGENLIVSIDSIFPHSDKTELKGSAKYSISNQISSSITNLIVDNFLAEKSFTFLILFTSKSFTKYTILNSIQFSNEGQFQILIQPNFDKKDFNDQRLNELGELVNSKLDIIQFPPGIDLNSTMFSIYLNSSIQIRGFTNFFSIFNKTVQIDSNIISLKIEYDIRSNSDRFCLTNETENSHSKCPNDYLRIQNINEAKEKVLHSKEFKLIILSNGNQTVDLTDILHNSITICSVCSFDLSQDNSNIFDTSFGFKFTNYNRNYTLTDSVTFSEQMVKSFHTFEIQNLIVNFSNEWNGQLMTFYSFCSNVYFECLNKKLLLTSELIKIDHFTLIRNGFYSNNFIDFQTSMVEFIDLKNPLISLFPSNTMTIDNSPKFTIPDDQMVIFEFQNEIQNVTIQSTSDNQHSNLPNLFINSTELCNFEIKGQFPSNYTGIIFNELHGTLYIPQAKQPTQINKLDDNSIIIIKSNDQLNSIKSNKVNTINSNQINNLNSNEVGDFNSNQVNQKYLNQYKLHMIEHKLELIKKNFEKHLLEIPSILNAQSNAIFNGLTDLRADAKLLCENNEKCIFNFDSILFDSQNSIKMDDNGVLQVNDAYYNETLSSIHVLPLTINSKLVFNEPSRLNIQKLTFSENHETELFISFSLNNRSYIEISEPLSSIPTKTTLKYLNGMDSAKYDLKNLLSEHYLDIICGPDLRCNNERKWSFNLISDIDMSEYEARCYTKSYMKQCIAIVSKNATPFIQPTSSPVPTIKPTISQTPIIDDNEKEKEKLSIILTVIAVIVAIGAISTVVFVVIKVVARCRKNRPDVIETNNVVEELNLEETGIDTPAKIDPSLEQGLL